MKVLLELSQEFWGFGKRPDHYVEEDILKQGMENKGVCVQNLGLGFKLCFREKYS